MVDLYPGLRKASNSNSREFNDPQEQMAGACLVTGRVGHKGTIHRSIGVGLPQRQRAWERHELRILPGEHQEST
jgi:hypothetical protein